ncbi:MAG: TonB-dependent receptor [Bryobacteraceae bacterium]
MLRRLQLSAARGRTLPAVLLVLCCVAGPGLAQNAGSGDIRGTVTDASGGVIPGAKVTLVDTDTGVTKVATTNDAGIYDAVSVRTGNYKLTFSKEGFGQFTRDSVTVDVGVTMVDAQLSVGAAVQQVEVTGQATLLQTESGQQGSELPKESMAMLPNVGQDWANFTQVLPGVSGGGTSFSVNGNMPWESNFLTDGGAITYPQSSNVDDAIFETVAEVAISTSSFDAQYGVGGSVFNEITKSGTNRFHGAAYYYVQNNFFNARSFFSGSVPNLRWDNYGGSIGGPIKKNKAFFYFNVDRLINRSSAYSYYTFATPAMAAGNFSSSVFPTVYDPATWNGTTRTAFPGNVIPSSRIDPLAAKIQAYFPQPNLPGVSNNWWKPQLSSSPLPRYFGRLDYQLNDKHRLTGSVMERDLPLFFPNPGCPTDCQQGDVDAQHVQISEIWTISATTVNEFRMAFARQGNWFDPVTAGTGWPSKLGWSYAEADVPPAVTIGGPIAGMTWGGSAVNALLTEASYDPSDVVTMIRGKHIIKFGGDYLAEQDNSTIWGNEQSGLFTFSGVYTQPSPSNSSGGGLGYADFLLGQVAAWSATNAPEVGMRMKIPQAFIQDDYKVTPHLTLNLGLRYEYQHGWDEIKNRIGVFDPTIQNSATGTLGAMWFGGQNGRTALQKTKPDIFLPRIGFAWSPMPKLSIRGGFGIYSYLWSLDNYGENALGFGFGGSGSLADSTYINPVFKLSSPNPPLNYVAASTNPAAYNGHAVNEYPYNTAIARNYQWSVSVQRQLPSSMVAEVAYVGSHGTGLPFEIDSNEVPANKLGPNAQNNRPFPQFLGINGDSYNAISNYDSLQVSMKKRFGHGASFDVNYTWSKMLDDQDSSGWGRIAGSPIYQDAYNPQVNYGPSQFDIGQALKGDVVYALPFGKGQTFLKDQGGIVDALLGGWHASGIFIIETGTPFTPVWGGANLSGSAPNGNLYLAGFSAAESWYPNVVGNWHASNQNVNQWFNPAAFAEPSPYTFGDMGRNVLFGPGERTLNFSMGKTFRIPKLGEGGQVQVRFDATNVFNHPCFSNPNANIGTPAAGIITGTTVGGRVLQLGARFAF